jgi:hypothetical protein
MYNSKISQKQKFSIGGFTKMFSFFKDMNMQRHYRRKPIYLFSGHLNYDMYYIIMSNRFN